MKTSTKLSIATALAVASSALFGIWREYHKPHPMAEKVVARQVPPEPSVTMELQGSFDGTNWFGITNITLTTITATNIEDLNLMRNLHYVRMSQP